MKRLFLILALVGLCGCSTLAERGEVIVKDGKKIYTPKEYQKITGQGSEVRWSDENGIKSGKLLPDFPKVEIEK